MKKYAAVLAVLLALVFAVPAHGGSRYDPVGETFSGVNAPYLLAGGEVSSDEFFTDADLASARLTMINVWDSTCANCRYELPFFQQAYEEYSRCGFNMVGVASHLLGSTDYVGSAEMVEEFGLTYTQVVMDTGIGAISNNVGFVPHTFLVDGTGEVIAFFGGFHTYEQVEKAVVSRLALPGDADCDGVLTMMDVSLVSGVVLNSATLSPLGTICADYDNSGNITMSDVSILYAVLMNATEH
ncbi:MAG: redoxin domain-containing protein [Clostridia bacterium]|nr:redoxin domain-containing protein [Clostridia bacterium]